MNDSDRAALVEELTQAQHDAWPGLDADFIVNTEAIMPIIDRLLSERDAEIREALEAEYERVKEENTGLMGDYDLETAGTLSGLSFAIGLAEEGAER